PACGMTTSFAWFVRGRIDHSWKANPAGSLLALLSASFIAWLVGSAVVNRPVGYSSLKAPIHGLLVAAVVLSVTSWMIRLIVSPAVLVRPGSSPGAVASTTGR